MNSVKDSYKSECGKSEPGKPKFFLLMPRKCTSLLIAKEVKSENDHFIVNFAPTMPYTSIPISEKTRAFIERNTGVKYSEIATIDHEELDRRIEKKIGKRLKLKVLENHNLDPRGSIYIFTGRIFRNTWLERLFLGFL